MGRSKRVSVVLVKLVVVGVTIATTVVRLSALPTAANASNESSAVRTTAGPKTVNFAHPPKATARPSGRGTRPFFPRDRAAYAQAKAAANNRAVAGRQGPAVRTLPVGAGPLTTAATGPLSVVNNFRGDDLNTQSNTFGNDQVVTPPDTTLATGNGFVVEPLNVSLSIYTSTGGLSGRQDLTNFFSPVLPSNHVLSDPQAVFDSVSTDHRFYMTMLGFDPVTYDSEVLLAVSTTSNPTGTWNLYTLTSTTAVLQDQPFLGIANDKLTVSVNDFDTSNTFLGSTTTVVNKSDADAGTGIHSWSPGTDPYFRPSPARSTSSTTTQYVVSNDSPNLDVMAITGVPSATTVPSRTKTSLPMNPTVTPPDAGQPGPGPAIATNDNRTLEAVWQNNVLWTALNDGCLPSGDTTERSCLRMIELAAPISGTPSVAQDFDGVVPGSYLYYPGVALDQSQNLYVSFTISDASTVFPSAQVLALTPATFSVATLQSGVLYNGLRVRIDPPPVRWGDYSGAAVDPTNPADVWVATEFGGGDSSQGAGTNWATQLSRVAASTLPPPSVVGVEGSDSALWVKHSGDAGFTGLGGVLIGAPAIAAVPQASGPLLPLYVVTGSDHRLWVRSDNQGFQLLTNNPTYCIDNPAAVVTGSAGNATLTVACQGGDHALYMIQGPVTAGTLPNLNEAWTGLGGVLVAGPAVAQVGTSLTFLANGSDGHIWSRTTTSTGFTRMPWTCLGHPALATSGTFACDGTDHALWYATSNGGGWNPTQTLGGVLVDGPGVAATSTGTAFYVEGSDSALWQNFVPNGGGPTGWIGDGGTLRQGAGAAGLG